MIVYTKGKKLFSMMLLLLSFFILGSAGLFAGGKQPEAAGAAKEVTFWGPYSGPDGELIQKLIERFNAEEPRINVKFHVVPWDEYYDKLSINVAAGTVPDVSIMHGHFMPGYAAQGVLTPLDEAVKSLGIKEEDYVPALWKAGEFEGVRYCVPLDTFPRFMFYNKRLLREAGLNPDLSETEPLAGEQLLSMAKKLTKGDQWGFIVPPGGNGLRRTWLSILWQNGGELLSGDRRSAAFDSEAGISAIQTMADMITKYKVMPAGEISVRDMLNQSKAAMASDQITELASHIGIDGLELGSAPFPLIGKQKATFAVGHNFVIPKAKKVDQERIKNALIFVKWMTENSFEYAKVGQVPANLNVIKSEEFKTLKHQWVAGMQWTWFRSPPAVPQLREIFDKALNPDLGKVMAGVKTAEQGVKDAADAANKILQK